MNENGIKVAGTDIEVGWNNYDPAAWREHPDPDDDAFENDEDGEWPKDIAGVLGFDPAEIQWDE